MGLVVNVNVRTGWLTVLVSMACVGLVGVGVEESLTTLRSFFDFWDLGVHLNGPLSRWTGKGVGDVCGVLEAQTLASIGLRFSRVHPPTFSAAHTDLEYSENHARDGGPPSHCIYVATGSTDFWQP